MAMSVQTVIEVCRHVINLTTVVMSLDVTTSRWFVSSISVSGRRIESEEVHC
jgi:hypothetical protein